MEVLELLQQLGVINIAVIIGIIAIMTQMRKFFLDTLLQKIKKGFCRWNILTILSLILSIGLTLLGYLNDFNLGEWIKFSIMNWVFAWVFHDTIKNVFFKEKENDK